MNKCGKACQIVVDFHATDSTTQFVTGELENHKPACAKYMGPMAANWFQFHCGQANWFVRFLPCNLEHEVLIQHILGVPQCQSNSNDPVADIWNYILIHKFSDGKNSNYTVYRIPHKAVENIAPKCRKPKSQEIIPTYNIFAFHNSPNEYIYIYA